MFINYWKGIALLEKIVALLKIVDDWMTKWNKNTMLHVFSFIMVLSMKSYIYRRGKNTINTGYNFKFKKKNISAIVIFL